MKIKIKHDQKGQALVEFALISIVLLTMIFAIVEGGRLFQGWLTVQNSARAAGRYAITGQFDPSCLNVFPPCLDPRVESIEQEVLRTVAGIPVDPTAIVGEPSSLVIEVWGQDQDDVWQPDYAGASGKQVRIRVTYFMPIITPLLRPIASSVQLAGQVVTVNENFDQFSSTQIINEPPTTGNIGGPVILPEADVAITKTITTADVKPGAPVSVYTGQEIEFNIDIKNFGPFDAEGVNISDLLITPFEYLGYTATRGGICDEPESPPVAVDRVDCQLANLAGDAGLESEKVVNVTLRFQTPLSPVNETLTNTVNLANDPSTLDPNPDDNSSYALFELIPHMDLEVLKEDSKDPAIVGEAFSYNVTLTNDGPNTAEDVVLFDQLPPDFTYQGHGISSGSCGPPNGSRIMTCDIGDVPPSTTIALIVSGIPTAEGTHTNTAYFDTSTHDDDPSNDTVAEDTGFILISDLEVSKRGPASVDYFDQFTYFIEVTNHGISPLNQNIPVIDTLPFWGGGGVVQYLSSSPGCGLSGGSIVTCNLSSLAVGETKQLTITVRAVWPGNAINRVQVNNPVTDPGVYSNNAMMNTMINPMANLLVQKSVVGPAVPGGYLDFSVTVINDGPSSADNIVVRDTLDPNVELDENTMSVSGCDSWSLDGNQIVCEINQLNASANKTVDITVKVIEDFSVEDDDTLVNSVTVTSDTFDYYPGNNSASVSTKYELPARLSITKSGPKRVIVGDNFIYNLVVVNNGPRHAHNVVIEDILPSQVSYVSSLPANACAETGGKVTCNIAELEPNDGPFNIQIIVSADQVGSADNTATVKADEVDSDTSDNTSTIQTEIADFEADISVELTDLSLSTSERITVTYTISNSGPSPAENVTLNVSTTIPNGALSLNNSNYSCSVQNNPDGDASIVCNTIGTLAPGGSYPVNLDISISLDGMYFQQGTVNTTTNEPNPGIPNQSEVGTIDVN